MTNKFTDKFIDNLKPKISIYDVREGGGFGVRVLPSGIKTWFFIYRFEGRRRFLNLGHYPSISLAEARKRYRSAFDLHEQGKDPLALEKFEQEERRKAPAVADLVREYIDRHAKRFKRSWRKDERILQHDVVPVWGNRNAADITKRDVISLLKAIVTRNAPAMANNTFQIIRKMFNFAVEKDILPHTPCAGIKLPAPKLAKDRFLTAEEIKTVWHYLDGLPAMTDEVTRALKLVLITGQRPGEVVGMHAGEIDGRWWTIPSERAKNGRAQRVYLADTALGLIGDHREGYIFPTPHKGKEQSIHAQALSKALQRNTVNGLVLGIQHFTPHDLRRTTATHLAELGFMDEVIDAVLNHAKAGIIKVYNQYRYDREKQQALETWERRLLSIVSEEQTKEPAKAGVDSAQVVPTPRRDS